MTNFKAANWNAKGHDTALTYWNQNIAQFWTEEEFSVEKDLGAWDSLTDVERDVYKKVLAGLTLLDTRQASEGMPLISLHIRDEQSKAVLSFMGMMEHIHAKSYSHIFTTLLPSQETDFLLNGWVAQQPHLQRKADTVVSYYEELFRPRVRPYTLYMALVHSVFLESFLFYSGFYFPVYLAGQGRMIASGEIIRKIIMDESIHGSYVGLKAQELRQQLTDVEREAADREMYTSLEALFKNEEAYTHEIYGKLGIASDVIEYVKYNANRALQNLGFEPFFEHAPVNPIVLNGLDTETKNHDFFSTKGDGYTISLNVETLRDEDFNFDNV